INVTARRNAKPLVMQAWPVHVDNSFASTNVGQNAIRTELSTNKEFRSNVLKRLSLICNYRLFCLGQNVSNHKDDPRAHQT
ncbi:MAG: hypothetical protein WCF38_16170, partial [Pseudolabrys sp.]